MNLGGGLPQLKEESIQKKMFEKKQKLIGPEDA